MNVVAMTEIGTIDTCVWQCQFYMVKKIYIPVLK